MLDTEPFDTLIVFLEECFDKVNFEKKSADDNKRLKASCIFCSKLAIKYIIR